MKLTVLSKKIADAVTALLIMVSIMAFVLSFHNLMGLAMDHGSPVWIAWMFPIMIDAFMIASVLTVVRFKMLKETMFYPWVMVALTTLSSIGFNIAAVYNMGSPLTMTIFAAPPIAVFGALEALMMIVRAEQAHQPVKSKVVKKTEQ